MKKVFNILFISFISVIFLIGIVYFFLIYEKPIDQKALNKFLQGQPIIDTHIHATKGYEGSEDYKKGLTEGPELDQATIDFVRKEFDENNVVIGLAGGPIYHAENWAKADPRFWAGPVFPFKIPYHMDEPSTKEFLTYEELYELYESKTFRSMGEAMYVHKGVHPHDRRLEAYWKIAAEFNMPLGIHSDEGPPRPMRAEILEDIHKGEYSDPDLLRPILEKYPGIKLYLMHFNGKYSDEAIQLMKEYEQIYCEISAISLHMPKILWEGKVKKLYEEGLGDRLMFASDYRGKIRENIEIIYSLEWLSEAHKRDIFYNNAARFLELTPEQIQEHHEMVK
ncbi:MAG: amidohydrolase family protein [Candidatus Cyclobacteriaceae bacterium M2_1C_046]